jgi:predicted nucleic-acid-binding protein
MTRFAGSLDTNVLLRLFLDDIPDQHQAVVNLLENNTNPSSAPFAVADTAIIEAAFVLERHYTFSREAIADAINGLMSLTETRCNHPLFEKALPIYTQHSKLSFEDCCLAVYAELDDAQPLWTFDKKLAQQTANARLLPPMQAL